MTSQPGGVYRMLPVSGGQIMEAQICLVASQKHQSLVGFVYCSTQRIQHGDLCFSDSKKH